MPSIRFPFAAIAVVLAPALSAQGAPPTPPSAPHERLAFFEGTWTVEELPAARKFRERCAWLEGGRRHIVCWSRSKGTSGEWREGLSMFSYRTADSVYVYYGLRPSGTTQTLTGRPTADGERWEFHGEDGSGPARERTLVRIMRLPGGLLRFTEATARGDAPFAAVDTVHYRPAHPEPATP